MILKRKKKLNESATKGSTLSMISTCYYTSPGVGECVLSLLYPEECIEDAPPKDVLPR